MPLPGRPLKRLDQRNVHLNVTISPAQYEWVRKKGAQASAILQAAINQLMKKQEDAETLAPSSIGLKVLEWRKMGLSDADILVKLKEEKNVDAAALSTEAPST